MKLKELPPEEELQKEIDEVMNAYLKANPEFKKIYEAETESVMNIKPGETVPASALVELMGVVFAYTEKKYGIEDPKVLSSEFEGGVR